MLLTLRVTLSYVIRVKKHLHNRNRKAIIEMESYRKEYESLHPFLCVFTVTPSKIRMQSSQYRKNPESGKWKKINIQKASPRIRSVRDIWKNVLPKFIKLWRHCIGVYATYSEKRFTQICKGLETPCWFPFERHKYGRRKPTETSFPTYAWIHHLRNS